MASELANNGLISEKMINSATEIQKAQKVIPGGVTANIKYFSPHPLVMEQGKGSHLIDVDGNEYIDYLLCYGALILGHGHPKVTEAVMKNMQALGTTIFGAPHRLELEMALKLVDLFPGIEMVRYTNSGLEATLLTIRLAEAYTGRTKIAKFEGHYHGGYDQMLLSVNPDIKKAGSEEKPIPVPESKGMSTYHLQNTIILPFNDLQATTKILRANQDELAAVILEPVQGGFIPADEAFIHGLRKITEELGILLIFDEVKTGFRMLVGGVQSYYHVTPDLTALGKVLGGGFPIGAVGGRRDIMEMMAPDRGRDIFTAGAKSTVKDDAVFHSGTYNGHPLILASGLATIKELEREGVMDDLLSKTLTLRKGLESLYNSYNIPMKTYGLGSMFSFILSDEPIKNYRDVHKANNALREDLDYELLKLGIYTKPLNRYCLSTAHTEEDIQVTLHAHEKAIKRTLKS